MRAARGWSRGLASLGAAIALAAASGAGAQGEPGRAPTATPPAVSTVAPRTAPVASDETTPAPEVAPLAVVRAAYDLLRQRYFVAVSPRSLLAAARGPDGVPDRSDGRAAGATDDADGAWADFAGGFEAIAGAVAPGSNPAHVAVRRMTASLDDCHTSFTADHARDSVALSRAEPYGGVGAVIRDAARFDPAPPGPIILQVFEGSPAAAAGLRPGDAVVAVDGVRVADVTGPLVERVRGTPGTTVVVRVDRPGAMATLEVPVVRSSVTVPLVASRTVAVVGVGPVGIVRLRSFSQPAAAPFVEAVAALRAAGVRAWVVDLRDNGGGDLGVFERVASLFVAGPLAVTVGRDGAPRVMSLANAPGPEEASPVDRVPVAVLANAETASAAELLAGDLGDYGMGRLFGERTAGCFGTSRLFRLPDGSGIWITVSALQTGLARRDVHRVGLAPAVAAPLRRQDLVAGRDAALEEALAWVQGRLATGGGDGRVMATR